MGQRNAAEIRCVLAVRAHLGESPVWSVPEQALYWIDVGEWPGSGGASLNRFDPVSGTNRRWNLPQPIGSLALDGSGGALVALASGVFHLDLTTQTLIPIASIPHDHTRARLNDGRCDRAGRFWVGSCQRPDLQENCAHLYCLEGPALQVRLDDIAISNGLAWSPDNRIMYFADSRQKTVFEFDYDIATGTADNRRVFLQLSGGLLPDGATVDAEGGYWVALYNAGKIARYHPDGTLDREIALPVSRPTMVAFGGADLATLYVTSASHRLSAEQLAAEPLAGGLFALEPGVHGLPEATWAHSTATTR